MWQIYIRNDFAADMAMKRNNPKNVIQEEFLISLKHQPEKLFLDFLDNKM